MKRKFWVTILSIAAVSCLVGGITACGTNSGSDDGGKDETDTTKVVLSDF